MWHGQNDIAGKVLGELADDFNATHKDIQVKATTGGVVADQMRQKITTALASGDYPDIAYIFGSDLANLARSDKVVDLTDAVNAPDFGWDDYYAPARDAMMVDGRVRALPALIDDLAVVYNKQLFAEAGRRRAAPRAGPGTTSGDRQALTDRDKGTFGTAWPAVGDEDTVWRWWPMVWQGGGEVITDDGKVGFGGAARRAGHGRRRPARAGRLGLRRHQARQRADVPGVQHDKIGMVLTGPWQLPDFIDAKIDYGVAPLPTFGGQPLTISAPDTWTIFDNGDARPKAAIEFVQWLNPPEQDAKWGPRRAPCRCARARRAARVAAVPEGVPGCRCSSTRSRARA